MTQLFPDSGATFYSNLLPFSMIEYLRYFTSASVLICLVTGISCFYKSKINRLNFVRGLFLFSMCFCLLGNQQAFSYLRESDIHRITLEQKIFFSFLYGFAVSACLISIFYVMSILGHLRNPIPHCLWSLTSIPALLALSSIMPSILIFVGLGKFLIFSLQSLAGVWSYAYIVKNKKRKVYFNYPFQNLIMSTAILVHTLGMWIDSPILMIVSRTVPGLIIIYFYVIEYNFPIFFQKETISNDFTELETEECIDKTKSANHSRNLLEGVNLCRIEENVNRFVLNREFLDEEIRLPDFSAYIGLSLHQASYYLNSYKKLSFSDFLNYHRLEEAKQMILANKEMNLLEIALACGFNSPSSFRRACIKFSEKSPKELRNHLIQEETPIQNLELQAQL